MWPFLSNFDKQKMSAYGRGKVSQKVTKSDGKGSGKCWPKARGKGGKVQQWTWNPKKMFNGSLGWQENALTKSFKMSHHLIYLEIVSKSLLWPAFGSGLHIKRDLLLSSRHIKWWLFWSSWWGRADGTPETLWTFFCISCFSATLWGLLYLTSFWKSSSYTWTKLLL